MNKPIPIRNEAVEQAKGKLDRLLITNEYFELKTRIHDRLLNLIDLSLSILLTKICSGKK